MRSAIKTHIRLLVICALAVLQVVLPIAHAQSGLPDTQAPIIEVEEIGSSTAGSTQVFTAQVVDDRELVEVTLYHRRAGQQSFETVAMTALGDSAFYSANVETDADDLRTIEYYVQARDGSGNRTVFGFAFDPLLRALSSSDIAASTDTSPAAPASEVSTGGGVKWWHVALGVVIAGSLAAAASGGGGGSDDDERTVPFTINLGEPQ